MATIRCYEILPDAEAAPRREIDPDAGPRLLTARQVQVLALVAHGYSHKQVARELGIAEHTVKNTLVTAFDKLEANNAPHAVALALRRGYLKLEDF